MRTRARRDQSHLLRCATRKELWWNRFSSRSRELTSATTRRVERLYRWYLDREDEENDDEDDKENDRTNSKCSRYHPGAAIQKFLNEYYFEPLAKLANKHEGTVLNFAALRVAYFEGDKGEGEDVEAMKTTTMMMTTTTKKKKKRKLL